MYTIAAPIADYKDKNHEYMETNNIMSTRICIRIKNERSIDIKNITK